MCSQYDPYSSVDELHRLFDLRSAPLKLKKGTVWPTGLAPFIRLAVDGSRERVLEEGHFGLLPVFAKEVAFGRKTYNARSETVHSKPSFRDSWRKGYRCVIPAECVYEISYETGKAVRWRISGAAYSLLRIAGIYSPWTDKDGVVRGTFAMITINADGHPVYSRFHAPGDEKRMIVLLEADEVDPWLTCSPQDAQAFFKQSTADLLATPSPLLGRRSAG